MRKSTLAAVSAAVLVALARLHGRARLRAARGAVPGGLADRLPHGGRSGQHQWWEQFGDPVLTS